MAEAAGAWLNSLDAATKKQAQLLFEDQERERWYYTPTWQAGVPMRELDPLQERAAHRVIGLGLSRSGYNTAAVIMGLENILAASEGGGRGDYPGRPGGGGAFRDPQMYFLAIFGEPGSKRWGWRAGGHHLSLNYTIVDGEVVSPVPCFFGANPAESEIGAGPLRPLARTEDLARDLLHSLDAGQRAMAIISKVAPADIVQSNRPQILDGVLPLPIGQVFSVPQPQLDAAMQRAQAAMEAGLTDAETERIRYSRDHARGIVGSSLNPGQVDGLRALLDEYVGRLPEALAVYERGRIERGGLDVVSFAWAGGTERGQKHYYRLQAPGLLIELDNVQNDGNHVHTVWRDPERDFGRDMLAAHYASAH